MTTNNNAMVSAIKHQDVRGKELLYLKIQANGKEVVINVGKATHEGVEELLKPRETSTTIQVLPGK